jgi:hypothetical protein
MDPGGERRKEGIMEQEQKEDTRFLEFEPRLLALFLFIAIPFTLIASLLILGSVRSDINRTIGNHLSEVAVDTASYMDSFILHSITNVSVLAATPTLRDAALAANRRYPADRRAAEARILELDAQWQKAKGDSPLAREIVGYPASEFLRDAEAANPAYRELFLTDERGAVVAATNPTTDFYQADEAWWQRAYGDGLTGTIFLGNVRFDPSAGVYAMEVAVPVRQKSGEETIVAGVLKGLIDARDLASVVGSVRVGETGHALLVDASDGVVISGGEGVDRSAYQGMPSLQQAMRDGRSSFVRPGEGSDRWLVGVSRMPEPSPSPELDWLVVVEQKTDEAHAPIRSATNYILVFFGGMVLTVVLFSLYMHFKLVRPIRQIDLREEMEKV